MAQGMVMNPTYMDGRTDGGTQQSSLIPVNWSKLAIILASYDSSAQIISCMRKLVASFSRAGLE